MASPAVASPAAGSPAVASPAAGSPAVASPAAGSSAGARGSILREGWWAAQGQCRGTVRLQGSHRRAATQGPFRGGGGWGTQTASASPAGPRAAEPEVRGGPTVRPRETPPARNNPGWQLMFPVPRGQQVSCERVPHKTLDLYGDAQPALRQSGYTRPRKARGPAAQTPARELPAVLLGGHAHVSQIGRYSYLPGSRSCA